MPSVVPQRDPKEIKRLRDSVSLGDPLWNLYNAELRFAQAYQSDPGDLETRIWKHIYQHSLKLFEKSEQEKPKPELPEPRWNVLPLPKSLPGLDRVTSTILINRGIKENIEKFIQAPIEDLDPAMEGVQKAVSLIRKAIDKKVPITIYGDYDTDGIAGTALAVDALRKLEANVDYYINSRYQDGYSVNENGMNEIASRGIPRLVITVDNGIGAHQAVQSAREKKMGVIITDHHEITGDVPNAHALVHPHSFHTPLSGAGVIFKVICCLYQQLGLNQEDNLLDLAALGTVADLVPLTGENRIIVKHGIIQLNQKPRPAVQALSQEVGMWHIRSEDISYRIAPIINSLSRMGGAADQAVEFLLAPDIESAAPTASYLKQLNEQRKDLVKKQAEEAEDMVDPTKRIIVLCSSFHEGVTGIIAGRLKEKYNRPAVVLSENEIHLRGSCRSIPGFNIKEALDKCEGIEQYGGHAMAAGLTIKKGDYDKFYRSLLRQGENIVLQPPVLNIDARLKKIDAALVRRIEKLEPYGEGFAPPLFIYECQVKEFKDIHGIHLKLAGNMECIVWGAYQKYIDAGRPEKIFLLGAPALDFYSNSVQFIARDFKAAESNDS